MEYSCECDSYWTKLNETACVYPVDICDESICINGECNTDFETNKTVCLCEEGKRHIYFDKIVNNPFLKDLLVMIVIQQLIIAQLL